MVVGGIVFIIICTTQKEHEIVGNFCAYKNKNITRLMATPAEPMARISGHFIES